ncbi:MAG: hypothetical protein EBQ89_11385 [Alphaproteobacteria bacterium]|nr:hypothetical protein [Alphaproteobacteria bacterium]
MRLSIDEIKIRKLKPLRRQGPITLTLFLGIIRVMGACLRRHNSCCALSMSMNPEPKNIDDTIDD